MGFVLQGICTAITFPLCIALLLLLGWNAYLMLTNKTTIEYYEGVTAEVKATRQGKQYQHPYDLGTSRFFFFPGSELCAL